VSDSRQEQRRKKRLSVKFGHDKLEHLGYLSDVSSQGFFVESRIVYKSGVILNVELKTRDNKIILIEGRVQWSKKGAPRLNHIMKSGMGIFILKFLKGEDVYRSLDDFREKSASCL
jgi:Tfp pilus assembly protein PilZ